MSNHSLPRFDKQGQRDFSPATNAALAALGITITGDHGLPSSTSDALLDVCYVLTDRVGSFNRTREQVIAIAEGREFAPDWAAHDANDQGFDDAQAGKPNRSNDYTKPTHAEAYNRGYANGYSLAIADARRHAQ